MIPPPSEIAWVVNARGQLQCDVTGFPDGGESALEARHRLSKVYLYPPYRIVRYRIVEESE